MSELFECVPTVLCGNQLTIIPAGGSPYSVISILDTLRMLKCDVSTVGFGMVGSTAAVLLAAGSKGKRFSMPNTRIMLQQPAGELCC